MPVVTVGVEVKFAKSNPVSVTGVDFKLAKSNPKVSTALVVSRAGKLVILNPVSTTGVDWTFCKLAISKPVSTIGEVFW